MRGFFGGTTERRNIHVQGTVRHKRTEPHGDRAVRRALPGGFFICRTDGSEELLYANKAVCAIFGCGSQEELRELTGFTLRGMVHPEDRERIVACAGLPTGADGDVPGDMDMEYRIIRRDGETR